MLSPRVVRKAARSLGGLVMLTVMMAGGCKGPPSHTARFWMTPGQTFALQVEGAQPTVQLAPDFGPLARVEWKHADGTTIFHGVPAGGELLLTLRDSDTLVFTDQLGSQIEISLWNSTGYTLTQLPGMTVAASESQGR